MSSADHDSFRSADMRQYEREWDSMPAALQAQLARQGIQGPIRESPTPINYAVKAPDLESILAEKNPYRPDSFTQEEDPSTSNADCRPQVADAVLRVLYVLTNSRNPELRLQTDLLLALINRVDAKSQAEIGRKHGLSRAAISKRLRDMRAGEFLQGLVGTHFGGDKSISNHAKTRATRVHRETIRILCKAPSKPSPMALARLRRATSTSSISNPASSEI